MAGYQISCLHAACLPDLVFNCSFQPSMKDRKRFWTPKVMRWEMWCCWKKAVDTSVYSMPCNTLGVSAIQINRKRLGCRIRAQKSAVKILRERSRSTGEDVSSVAPERKNENVLKGIVLDDAENPVANTVHAVLEGPLQKYCRTFQCPIKNVPDQLDQCGCDIEIKMEVVLTDPSYNNRQVHELQTSDCDLFDKDHIAEMLYMCGVYLNLGGHAHIFFS